MAFAGRRVVLRTLDAGADKPLPFLGLDAEPNPALGVRGLRVARARPEVLATQLQAVAEAADGSGAEVWVMAPIVATAAEAGWFRAQARAQGLSVAGGRDPLRRATGRAGARCRRFRQPGHQRPRAVHPCGRPHDRRAGRPPRLLAAGLARPGGGDRRGGP